jgi:hypothetical protein
VVIELHGEGFDSLHPLLPDCEALTPHNRPNQ